MYCLTFRGYRKEKLHVDDLHFFDNLRDAHAHAAWLLQFMSIDNWCDRYDIRVELAEIDQMPLAA